VSSTDTALVSVIMPVGERHADLDALYDEYRTALQRLPERHEFVIVLDGPHVDATRQVLALIERGEPVTLVRLSRPFGEATALMVGLAHSTGDLLLTLPAYSQIVPAEVCALVEAIRDCDVAVAVRDRKKGGVAGKLRRWAFHRILKTFTGQTFRDLGCSARALRREVLEQLTVYGDQHRFIPVFAQQHGFRVREVEVRRSPFDRRLEAYRPRVYARRALDLLNVLFLVRFTKKPLRFFGFIGTVIAGIGALAMLVIVVQRLLHVQELADRPALLIASLLVVLGVQLVSLGVLGELIIYTHARDIKDYHVEEVIQYRNPADASP